MARQCEVPGRIAATVLAGNDVFHVKGGIREVLFSDIAILAAFIGTAADKSPQLGSDHPAVLL
ncbi:MAG: hypothetical protein R3C59_27060 [Planctomycetaceae bacterium]